MSSLIPLTYKPSSSSPLFPCSPPHPASAPYSILLHLRQTLLNFSKYFFIYPHLDHRKNRLLYSVLLYLHHKLSPRCCHTYEFNLAKREKKSLQHGRGRVVGRPGGRLTVKPIPFFFFVGQKYSTWMIDDALGCRCVVLAGGSQP